MNDKNYLKSNSDNDEKIDYCPLPLKTKIPANFTANQLIGKDTKQKLLEKNLIRIDQNGNDIQRTIEEITTCFNNGGGGLDLTFTQNCILLGIAMLHTEKGYPNAIECSKQELFTAAGYDNPSGGQRQRLEKAAEELANQKFPIYWVEQCGNGRRFKWITYDTLIRLAWGIEIEDGDDNNELLPSKAKFARYKIAFNKMFIGDWVDGFRLCEPGIAKEIREYRQQEGKEPSKFDIRFYYLLIGENKKIIKRNYLEIAKNPMLMDHYIKQRKHKLVRDKLNSIYKMYKDLGYLLAYEIDKKGTKKKLDVFCLNPERFYRLR